jgi:hypothetical protein
MKFEWDEVKNQINIKKHGINFNDVIGVFEQPMVVYLDVRNDYKENRWLGIGMMKYHVVVIVYTERVGDVIRIISARKANKREVSYYVETIEN